MLKLTQKYIIFFIFLLALSAHGETTGTLPADIFFAPGIHPQPSSETPTYKHDYVSTAQLTPRSYTDKNNVKASVDAALGEFEQWFNVKIESTDQLVEFASVVIAAFYTKLRICAPGTYDYLLPNILFGWRVNNKLEPKYFLAMAKINGMKDNKCNFDTAIAKHDDVIKMHCEFYAPFLSFFTDNRARNAARNNFYYSNAELSDLEQMLQGCRVLTNSNVF